MSKTDLVYLKHVQDAIKQIGIYLDGISTEEFSETQLLQDDVVRQLEIIGEACTKVSELTQEAYPQVPWGQIIGLRNRLIHAYFSVNLQTVWEITEIDLPPLKIEIDQIINDLES